PSSVPRAVCACAHDSHAASSRIVKAGSKGVRAMCRSLARRHGLAGRVRGRMGRVPGAANPGGEVLARIANPVDGILPPTIFTDAPVPHSPEEKKKVLARVRRIRGQCDALDRALEAGADCAPVLQQIAAIRGAVNGL